MEKGKHTPGRLQIDDCPDADGFTTIRPELPGSPHGDTDAQPIATVYEIEDANGSRLVACWNACEGMPDPATDVPTLVEALRNLAETINCQADELSEAEIAYVPELAAALSILARLDGESAR